MKGPLEAASQRLRTAFDLFEAGCEMKRMALRRQYPGLNQDDERRLLGQWLRDKEVPLANVPGFRLRKEDA
ncbi:MAG: hypothetical protein PHQ53_06330 [Candidatus Krumholzibacteria bacterium]|nr:hypothetical protein [Candidatus Krumholzibacteria bacterium]